MAKTGHRTGVWKQSNKTHKTGGHRSKGAIRASVSGKPTGGKVIHSGKAGLSTKSTRKHQALSFRNKKEAEQRMAYRPHHLVFFPLGNDPEGMEKIHANLTCSGEAKTTVGSGYTVKLDKNRFSITRPNEITSMLIQTQVADAMVLCVRYDEEFLMENIAILRMLAQGTGLPTILLAIQGLSELAASKQMAARRDVLTRFEKLHLVCTDKMKTFPVDSISDTQALLRQTALVKKVVRGHKNRPFLLAEEIKVDGNALKVTGYLSSAISVNLPIHVPGVGDFLLSHVETESGEVIIKCNEAKQPDLNPEAEVDMLDAEQTFPTEEELAEAKIDEAPVKIKVPKGFSSYQSAWIPDEDLDGGSESDSEGEEENDDMPPLEGDDDDNMEYVEDEEMIDQEQSGRVRFDTNPTDETDPSDLYDKNFDYEEDQQLLKLHRDAREDREFPDEIDTPEDAKTRFAKYRGLASFRTSPWDVNENLPAEYAKIFKFRRWAHAKIRARKWVPEVAETVAAGQRLTLVLKIKEEDKTSLKNISDLDSLILFGLLSNEHRMSVMHLVMKRAPGFTDELANKSELYFSCGFRRFLAKPVFSSHTNGNKHKMERFLPEDSTRIVMSMFSPIMFPPAGVLAFVKTKTGEMRLAATGSVFSCNPDRINLKRIVISGAPFKINKKSAVARFMFHNREDIEWFKPVQLRTKYGRRGHIKEGVGTHGHFKCVFDQHITSMDTVLMTMYKRVFPKWFYQPVPKFESQLIV